MRITSVNEDDIFVYLTDISCQLSEFKNTTVDIPVGRNYEPDTLTFEVPILTVSGKGYTSPYLAGKNISFSISGGSWPYVPQNGNATIKSDGSFEFSDTFTISSQYLWDFAFSFYFSVELANDMLRTQLPLGVSVNEVKIS